MRKQELFDRLYSSAIVPVVAIDDSNDVMELGDAFLRAGLQVVEITLRTEAASDAIRKLKGSGRDITVGAGTVLTLDMARKAVDAGAEFLVTPGFDEEVVDWAVRHEVSVIPGTATPGEMARAMKYGLDAVKFFPSEAAGGIKMLKSLAGPYSSLRFMPTGGISQKNIGDYMELGNVLACGGSWMCTSEMIRRHEFDRITDLACEAIRTIHDFSLLHVGINSNDEEEAKKTADAFGKLLRTQITEGASLFAGDIIEINKKPGRGRNGHIAVSVRNIDRAMAYFKAQGYQFDETNMPADDEGIIAAYFADEIGGFAVHLRRHL